jgi:hypothetical protein
MFSHTSPRSSLSPFSSGLYYDSSYNIAHDDPFEYLFLRSTAFRLFLVQSKNHLHVLNATSLLWKSDFSFNENETILDLHPLTNITDSDANQTFFVLTAFSGYYTATYVVNVVYILSLSSEGNITVLSQNSFNGSASLAGGVPACTFRDAEFVYFPQGFSRSNVSEQSMNITRLDLQTGLPVDSFSLRCTNCGPLLRLSEWLDSRCTRLSPNMVFYGQGFYSTFAVLHLVAQSYTYVEESVANKERKGIEEEVVY